MSFSRLINYESSRKVLKTMLIAAVFITACSPDLSDDPIPRIPFAPFIVNIFLPEYQPLMIDGGTKTIANIGVRGVIVYRSSATSYIAYEKNCSYHPNEAGSTIDVHGSRLYLVCSGCGSNFSLNDGSVTGGVAWRPLRRYRVEFSNPLLTITDDIAN